MSTQIFISYRRDGGEFLGKCLYDYLCQEGYSVFYDVESMDAGKFNVILVCIECCQYCLFVTMMMTMQQYFQ